MAQGYPAGTVAKGDLIAGLDREYPNVSIQLAGVAKQTDNTYKTDGGRVLYATGVHETVDKAATSAYSAIGANAIHFAGYRYRTDIAERAR
jgi:phosphoribosylamine-glycine ligase